MSKQKITQKYFHALQDLHQLLKCTDQFHATKFESQRNVPHNFILCAVQHKLIERSGTKRNYKYKWNTIEPTLEMAVGLRLQMTKYQQQKKAEREKSENQHKIEYQSTVVHKPKKRYNADDVPAYIEEHNQKSNLNPVIEKQHTTQSIQVNQHFITKSFSIFWGLFKFERRIEK